MEFVDRFLTCNDCGGVFIFTAGEQLFFFDKQFKNDPKRCKPCKSKRAAGRPGAGAATAGLARTETRTECSACGVETTVPFKPTQGRPVLCRQCFQGRQSSSITTIGLDEATSALHAATAELMAGAATGEHVVVELISRVRQA
jgi:CxxC-x17-CxxC domain-containing protein